MKYKWILHPERDANGDGSIVAEGYFTELLEYPICIIRSYSKYYRVEIFNKRTSIDIYYDNVELTRLNRKLLKKQRKGLLTPEQHTKINLLVVCNMVESRKIF